jgi:hypothetical protein
LPLSQKPTKQTTIWLPGPAGAGCRLDLYTLLMYLRQNLLQYLYVMNGADPEHYADIHPTAPLPRAPTPLRYVGRRDWVTMRDFPFFLCNGI